VGFLYIRKKILLPEYIHGGKQERDHRAGTENVPGIAGMGKAAEIAFTTREYREKEIQQLRDYLIRRLQRGIPYCRLNGSLTNRLPGNCNISFQFIEGNELLLLLDEKNICASAASACSTGDTSPSHVLTAMGIPEKLARGTLRLTIGYQNTQEEIDYTVQCIKEAVEKLRENAEDYRRYKETFPCNIM
jgi:cysteine desulfurase